MKAYNLTVQEVLKNYGLNEKRGLSQEKVLKMREVYGKNETLSKKPKSFIKRLIDALSEPTLLILEFAWVVTLGVNVGKQLKNGSGDFLECVGILLAVALSASLTLIMEGKSQRAFEMLGKVYDKISVKVIRDGVITLIPKEQVVCGDVLLVETGDKIVADGRVIESNQLKIDESMLTGESDRVEKFADKWYDEDTPLAERRNMVYSGTFVGSGSGKMVVTAVGNDAELGKIAGELGYKNVANAPLNQKLNKLGKLITLIGAITSVAVFLLSVTRLAILNQISFFTLQEAFLEAVVLIVAAVPEGLPSTAAISLTLNVVKLAKSNALIRKLVAAETSGCISVICSDKTGTLTQNQMTVEKLKPYAKTEERVVLENALLNSSAQLKISAKRVEVFGSATEGALLKYCNQKGIDYQKYRENQPIGRVLPFDSSKKYMATELKNKKVVYFKGAPEVIVKGTSLAQEEQEKVLKEIESYQQKGKRVIAFSCIKGDWNGQGVDENSAEFNGYAVISDPIRKGVKESVKACFNAGISVVMMTGDNVTTATAIAFELGIANDNSQIVQAVQIERMTDAQLKQNIDQIKVIARSTPTTKLRVVEALKKRGEVVAVTGDGVNDAPAIQRADVGIVMGSGSEITKEAGDVILLDDSFSTIVKAISFGRNIYKNFQRFITFQLTVNVSAMIVVIVSLVVGLKNPFSSVQLLWIDIIMDGPPALTLAMEADVGKFMKSRPVKRSEPILTRSMISRIALQGVFSAIVIVLEYLYDFMGVGFQNIPTVVFCTFVMFQLFNAFNCRKIGSESIFNGLADNKLMLYVFGATFLFQIVITQFLCDFFATVPLSFVTWLKIILVSSSTITFSEIYKLFYRILKANTKSVKASANKLN
ncbi:MAG: calcium-translocating P-type ATPase, PMCA-type [Clostridia bacterium]|nr:calcium-translocating P-type ATPase, PMCA-type [Clostridia bacterium]